MAMFDPASGAVGGGFLGGRLIGAAILAVALGGLGLAFGRAACPTDEPRLERIELELRELDSDDGDEAVDAEAEPPTDDTDECPCGALDDDDPSEVVPEVVID
jgi:hypothetical protein